MDMTPEALFALVEPHRAARELEAKTVLRCKSRGCHQIGTYVFRGTVVTIVTPIRLSSGKAAELGIDRRVPGRAWIDTAPAGEIYGCDHHLAFTT
jgi:hypothetical protein